MSVIIRLQGLPWSASAMNIRHFFTGLSIPAGGVHIIGGEGGDAFIAFSSDDDARMAMKMNMCPLNGTPVQLFLSSKSEMQSVIDAARSGSSITSMPSVTLASNANPGSTAMSGSDSQQSIPMSTGYTGMPGLNTNTQYGAGNTGFPAMQQGADVTSGNANLGMVGLGGKNEWQPMPGMMAGGRGDGSVNSNQRLMMGGEDQGNNANRFARYQDNRPGNTLMPGVGQMPPGQMPMPGIGERQHAGMEPSGQDPMSQGQGRFGGGDDMRMNNLGPGANPNFGQYGGMEMRDKMPGFMPGQMDRDTNMEAMKRNDPTSKRPDPIKPPVSGGLMDMGRNPPPSSVNDKMPMMGGFNEQTGSQVNDLMKDRFGNQMMTPPASGSPGFGVGQVGQGTWAGHKKQDGTFSDITKSQDETKDPKDMPPEPPFKRDPAHRVSRFSDASDHPGQDSFGQPRRSNERDMNERDKRFPPSRFHDGPRDRMDNNIPPPNIPPQREYPDRDRDRPSGDRRVPLGDDGLPSTRYPPDDDQFPEDSRFPAGRGGPDDRRPPGRSMPDDMRPQMTDESRMPPNDRGRFGNDERGFGPGDGGRYPPRGEYFPDSDRRFPHDQRFMEHERNMQPFGDRPYPGDNRRPPHGEGRFMPEDRKGMWQGERQRPEEMTGRRPEEMMGRRPEEMMGRRPEEMMGHRSEELMGRRSEEMMGRRSEEMMGRRPEEMMGRGPGDNHFPPEDPRHREREQELRREAFERGHHGPNSDWPPPRELMHRGRMDFLDHPPGSDDLSGRPFQGDRRGFPNERQGGPPFREDEREFHAPPGKMDGRPDGGPQRWGRFEGGDMDRPDIGGRAPFLGNPDGPMAHPDRGPMPNAPPTDSEGPFDMDQRIHRGMEGNRRPGMPPTSYGRGERPMEGDFASGPHDFDNRAMGPRGRGPGMVGDRPPRGRGDPFTRGRPGPAPFGRGRGMDVDRRVEETSQMGQDVDNRTIRDAQAPGMPAKAPLPPDGGPKPGQGKSLLGDGPGEPGSGQGREQPVSNKPEDSRSDRSRSETESRFSRREPRDRDRRYDERRGRDRDDRDRYRGRYDRDRDRDRERDRDRDRDRDRRRTRSRSRDRDRDRHSRDRSSRDKGSSPDSDFSKTSNVNKRSDQRPSKYLHLTNMPLTVSYRDVRMFFHPLEIPYDGLKLINDAQGNRNGEAYVYFYRLETAIRAQKKNGERYGGKVVSIVFTPEDAFAKAVDSFVPIIPPTKKDSNVSSTPKASNATPTTAKTDNTTAKTDNSRFVVQVNNLPQSITRQDINQFFCNLKIDKEGEAAYIEFDDSGAATGKGFVEFKTEMDYRKALTHNGLLLGTSNIRVVPGNVQDADKLKAVQGEMFQRAALRSLSNRAAPAHKPNQVGVRPKLPQTGKPLVPTTTTAAATPTAAAAAATTTSTSTTGAKPLIASSPAKDDSGSGETVCVHIQGLPLLATPRDIKEFFSDCQIALRGINIAHDSQGKPLGEGFVEFKFPVDFEKALKKDKTSMGRHIVAVKAISKKDLIGRLDNAKQQGAPPRPLINAISPAPQGNQSKPLVPPVQAQPPPQNNNSLKSSASPQLPQGQPDSRAPSNPQNIPLPIPLPKLPASLTSPEAKATTLPIPSPNAPQSQSHPRGPTPDTGKAQVGGPMMPLLQTPATQVMMPGGGKSFPPGVLNNNWYYVRCQNFPPDISIGEIMNFFKGFRPIGESIRLHYSNEGQPTGNAVVGFASGEDATKALQYLNMRACRHNIVSLHPA